MIRTIIIIIFVYLCFKVVKDVLLKFILSNYKTTSFKSPPRDASRYIDEMVKDPVCEVYIPKRNAVTATFSGEEYFFCSRACMLKFKEKKQAAGDATAPQQTAALPPEPTPEGVYNEAYNTLQSGNNRAAREQFKKFLNTYKSSELADNAQFWIGESYYREKKFEEAILSFEDLIKLFPKSAKIPEAYYKQAIAFSAINDPVAARAKLEMLLNEYPDNALSQRAKQKLKELEQQNPAETD